MISKSIQEHNGVKYIHITSDIPTEVSLTSGSKKFVLKGKFEITIISGSYKFGRQVQINVFNSIGSTKETDRTPYAARDDGWDRMETFVDPKEFKEIGVEVLSELSEL